MVLSNSRRYDESIGAFNESIKLEPYFCSAWDQKGFDFYKLNKYDNALEAYEKAIQLDPGDEFYWIDKGDALKALGRTTEANAAYARASEPRYDSSTGTRGTTAISSSPTPGTPALLIIAWQATLTSPPIM
jgi:tetratricopeptide (TPR) repeat protein